MVENKPSWFVKQRTRALAMVHLTRRDDLVVTARPQEGVDLDLLVRITKKGEERSLRQFGVLLRGRRDALTETQLDKKLRPTLQSLARTGPFLYPVCLFYFTMVGDQGYYTWVAEPAVAEEEPRLLMHEHAHCRKLDRPALDEIVGLVDRWYDAFFSRITVKAS
jgi:hypothetical protein